MGGYSEIGWRQLGTFARMSDWPRQGILRGRPAASRTVGATARHIARTAPGILKHAGEGWTRAEIEEVVRNVIADELGIASFSWDDHFVEDLRVD